MSKLKEQALDELSEITGIKITKSNLISWDIIDPLITKLENENEYNINLLVKLINAWESLDEGEYEAEVVTKWLWDDMKPIIDDIRDFLTVKELNDDNMRTKQETK